MTVITSRKWVLLCVCVCVWKGGLFGNLYVAEKGSSLEHHSILLWCDHRHHYRHRPPRRHWPME